MSNPMKLESFCIAERIEVNGDNTPLIHGQIDNVFAPQFPVTIPCVMCCIVVGRRDERPESYILNFRLENEQGEFLKSQTIGVRSNHIEDYKQPPSLFRSLHVLPPIQLTFKAPGIYIARLTVEESHSIEQMIVMSLQSSALATV